MPDEILTDEQIVDNASAAADAAAAEPTAAAAAADADGAMPLPEGETPAAAADGSTTKPAGDPAVAAAAAADDVTDNLIPAEDLSLKSLRGFLQKYPDLAKLDQTDKNFHNFLHASVRRSAALEEYRGVYATPESAKDALAAATDMIQFESDFFDHTNGGATKTLERLYQMSLVRDEQGNVIVENGVARSTGAFEGLVTQLRNDLFSQIEQYAKSQKDEYGIEALAHIRGMFGERTAKSTAGGTARSEASDAGDGTVEESDEVKSMRARLAKYEEGDRTRASEQVQQYNTQLRSEMDGGVMEDAAKLMKDIVTTNKLALNDKMQKLLVSDAVRALAEKATRDPAYTNMLATLSRKGRSESTRKEIVKQVRQYGMRHLPQFIAQGLHETTGSVIAGHAAKQQKLTQQKSQANVSSSGAAPSPHTPSVQERLAERQKQAGKRRLTDLEVLNEISDTE